MGVGYALASGLVKGFTQNIGMRLQEQQTARAKFDALEQQLLAAPLTDDFSAKNVDAIRDYISQGRQAVEDQEIDLFGTRTEPLVDDDALGTLVSSLETTTDKDIDAARTFMYDKKPYYTFNREVRNASNTYDATANLNEIAYMIGHNEEARTKWMAAPDSVKEDILQVARFNASALAVDVEKNRSEGQDILNLDVVGIGTTGEALDRFFRLAIPDYKGNIIGKAFRINAENATGSGDGSGSSGSTVFTKRGVHNIDAPGDAETPAYNALTISFGLPAGDLDALNATWSEYTNVFGMTDADSDALWDKTIQFMTENDITTQFQSASAIGMMDEKLAAQYLKSLGEITNNDAKQMALIVGALYTPRSFTETKKASATRIPNTSSKTIPDQDIRLYTAKVLFGAYATEQDFTAIVNQDSQLGKVLSKEVGLGALLEIADKEMQTIPLAYAVASKFAGIKNLAGFIFGGNEETTTAAEVDVFTIENATDGKTIVIDASTGELVSQRAISAEDQKAIDEGEVMTVGYINSLNDRISAARQRARRNYEKRPEDMRDMSIEDMEEMYARFESLRISLAFQMARAADPSGRLSDQDVRQMMALLGGDINTPRAMKAKIRRAMDEFEYQRQRFSAVIPFSAASGQATRTDKLRVHGVHGLDVMAKRAGLLGSGDLQAQAAADQKLTIIQPNETYAGGAVKIGDTVYLPGGNGTWYPDGSFMAVEDETLLKTLNEAMPET